MANSASHAALPYPIKNARFTVQIPYLDADGDPTDPTTPDTEISEDGGAFTDCAEEVTTITGSNGGGYITLTGAETDNSMFMLAAKVASGPKATLGTFYPRQLVSIGTGTLSAGSAGGGTLGTVLAYDITGCFIKTTGGTGGGGTGGANNQARKIMTYNTSTGAFTVEPNWETTPSTDTTYAILLPEGVTLGMLWALNPATPGRTLQVESDGMAHADVKEWGGTAVASANVLIDGAITAAKFGAGAVNAAALAADAVAEIADGVWDEDATGHQTQGSFGQAIGDPGADSDTIWALVNTNLDAQVSTRSSHSAADVWAVGVRTVTAATNITSTGGTIPITAGGLVSSDVTAISTSTVAADNAEIVFDTDFATNYSTSLDKWNTNVASLDNNSITAAVLADGAIDRATFAADTGQQTIRSGTAQGGGLSTLTLDAGASAVADFYKNRRLYLTGGTGAGQDSLITTYNQATKVATVHGTWRVTPDATTTFAILPDAQVDTHLFDTVALSTAVAHFGVNIVNAGNVAWASGSITSSVIATGAIDADSLAADAVNEIADQVWEEAIADHSGTSGSTAEALAAAGSAGDPWTTVLPGAYAGSQAGKILADILVDTGTTLQAEVDDIQTRLPAALVGGRMDSSVGAVDGDAALADKWVKILSGLIEHTVDDTDVPPSTTSFEVFDAGGAGRSEKWLDTVIFISEATDSENLGYPVLIDDAQEINDGKTLLILKRAIPLALTAGDMVMRIAAWGPGVSYEDIADQVWEEAIADHSGTAGSTAEALSNAAAGGADPWATALPGAYAAGQAGYILGTNLDTTVSSRPTAAAIDAVLTAAHGAGAWTTGGGGTVGPGAISTTLVIKLDNGTVVSNCEVWVTTDLAGATVIAGTLTTDSFGKVTFMLDPGTYYSWRQKPGVNFDNPESFTVT